ncbi:penicillin-binding transpeptidase domain-containing protein [Kitasatospora sp. NPDC048538]|uniref:penicillin-binding transpeptidase domain-containing protein n=1 Tax=unclassified Kitasatospora TaxID=2633591 RepID=UPI0033D6E757
MRRGAKIGIITGVSVAVLAGGGYGAYSLVGGSGSGSSSDKKPRTVVAEPPSAEQAANGAKDFLAAWAAGDLDKAASLTDDPAAATTALTAFRDQVKPSGLTLSPAGPATPQAFAAATGTPSPAAKPSAGASATPSAGATPGATDSPSAAASPAPTGVLMGYKARAEFAGTNRVWDYNGFLSVVKMSDDTPAVHWAPTVIHPHLSGNETIATQQVFAPPSNAVDRNGKALQGASLTPALLATLQDNAHKLVPDPNKDQDAGSAVVISDPSGKTANDKLFTIVEPKPGKPFKVTIDNAIQAAAEKAMTDLGGKSGSIVAIEPSTGQVLAFANAPASGQNRAFTGLLAPGSTMKIVTSAALLEAGVNPDTVVACPEKSSNAVAVPNSFPGAFPNNTLQQDFMMSCNTAFINQGLTSLKPDTLSGTAKDLFGIGLEWKTGLPNADGKVPSPGSNKDEQAMNYIGQGKVQMNPLAIASITATVQSGEFKQPILVADLPQQKAARPLSADVDGKLKAMMAATAQGGTAKDVMAGITDNAGAKTGSAEVAGATVTNSWFTAYRGNIAVAAEVQGGGHGVDAAGPAVASLLKAAGTR